ncbi:MAG: hypothetical protein MZW92_40015 [Comamonadaceae bacterium]|nr:hypothetical protein [Comamonadaceae bacterium]
MKARLTFAIAALCALRRPARPRRVARGHGRPRPAPTSPPSRSPTSRSPTRPRSATTERLRDAVECLPRRPTRPHAARLPGRIAWAAADL